MMHSVHFRGNQEKAQHPIDRLREANIAMIEKAGGIEENLKENHSQWTNCQNKNRPDLDAHRKEDFQGMEANPGGGVKIEVRVVHHVQAPKDGESMEHGMLQIDYKIEKHYADKDNQPMGQPALHHESPTATLIQRSHVNCRDWKNQTQGQSVDEDDPQIGKPATLFGCAIGPARGNPFPEAHEGQDPGKETKPYGGFVAYNKFIHSIALFLNF